MSVVDLFFSTCFDGNRSAVEIFLLKGISPDIQNAEGETALQIAAACGYLDIVSLLLSKRASIDLPNNYGWTPLMHAARHGNSEVVSFLIQMKAKVNVCNRLGLRPIDLAAWSGSLSCVQSIIDAGAIIDNLSNFENDLCDISPLMAASLQGHDFVVRTLFKNGCAANEASSITGLTPLMLAACNGHKSIAEMLVEFGSDVNAMDMCSQTALDLATISHKQDIIIFLEDLTHQTTKMSNDDIPIAADILKIVRSGDISKLKLLLQKNRSLSNYSHPDDGVTPLMISCMLGFANIVDLLVSSGADLNAQDVTNGWTPLMYAVFHRQAEIVHLLLDKEVDIDVCTFNGYTALDLAIHADSSGTDILETLLAYSGTKDLLDVGDYLTASTSTTKKSSSTFDRTSSRNDSQARFKDLLGGLTSHLRQFSRSSVASVSNDQEVFDETLSDVFPEDDVQEAADKEKFLCLSKFYAPNERFAHLLKEQEVEAIRLPPLPDHVDVTNLVKTIIPKKEKAGKSSFSEPRFSSLRTPNLVKGYWKKKMSGSTLKYATDLTLKDLRVGTDYKNLELGESSTTKSTVTETCTTEDLPVFSNQESLKKAPKKPTDQQYPKHKSSLSKGSAAEGLTALLNEESLKKYAEKFRDQEIDLETFKYLTEEDLNEIGISSFNSRHKLLDIIDKLKNS